MQTISKQQPGLFDYELRVDALKQQGYPLDKLNQRIDWEEFREELSKAFYNPSKGPGGRPRFDIVFMYKVLLIQRYYNLSDDQLEFQINDRVSFQDFLGISLADKVPDAKTIWEYREDLVKAGVFDKLFEQFKAKLKGAGLMGEEGKIVDASFVEVPIQRNSREENKEIKEGKVPAEFEANEHKKRQKDVDARWTKKNNQSHYGYKNHIKATRKHKLIEDYEVTDASVHDSQELDNLVEEGDGEVHADSAYASEETKEVFKNKGLKYRIHKRAYRNRPLSDADKEENRQKSKIRARVEHVFGHITNSLSKGLDLRYIGKQRIKAMVGFTNLLYNMCRYEQIQRLGLA